MRFDHGMLIVAALCAVLPACGRSKARPGQWFHCTCPYLTDYDDRAKHEVEVCVPTPQEAAKAAAQCAAQAQPGHFDPCDCREPKGTCDGTVTCHSLEMAR